MTFESHRKPPGRRSRDGSDNAADRGTGWSRRLASLTRRLPVTVTLTESGPGPGPGRAQSPSHSRVRTARRVPQPPGGAAAPGSHRDRDGNCRSESAPDS